LRFAIDPSVIIDNFHFIRVTIPPAKADAPSIIDLNAVLARAITFELLEPVAWGDPQFLELLGGIDDGELTEHCPLQVGRVSAGGFPFKESFSVAIAEAMDHDV
jgi:hypothetical protein